MFVMTEPFCQDPLENWFGKQRSLGSRKDNPSIASMAHFGYNNNAIRNQKKFKPIVNGHCVKSVQIRSYFWFEYRKIRIGNNSIFGHFSRSR